jgi:DNA invertase Pin-like site-specific DNA recombinase
MEHQNPAAMSIIIERLTQLGAALDYLADQIDAMDLRLMVLDARLAERERARTAQAVRAAQASHPAKGSGPGRPGLRVLR